MTWTEYLQWSAETRAAIAAAAQSCTVQAGHGVSIDGGRVAVRAKAQVPPMVSPKKFFILHVLAATSGIAYADSQANRDGSIGSPFAFQLHDEEDKDYVKVSFQAGGKEGSRFFYLFPVRITISQYIERLNPDNTSSEDLIKSYTIDLRRGAEERTFRHTRSARFSEIVRLVKIERI